MSHSEGDYVEHEKLPGVVWQIFEKTQIETYTLNLRHEPEGYEVDPNFRFLYEILKSGELVEEQFLRPANPMLVLAIEQTDHE